MGILFSTLWSLFSSERIKIVVLGLDNAGKSTILYQLLQEETVQTSPTIGSNVEEMHKFNLHFIIWDIGGQESLRSSWSAYFPGSQFVIYVVDSTDRERLPLCRQAFHTVISSPDLENAKILVFANKQDVDNCMTAAEISNALGLTKIKDKTWHIQACCAITNTGLHEGMEWIANQQKR